MQRFAFTVKDVARLTFLNLVYKTEQHLYHIPKKIISFSPIWHPFYKTRTFIHMDRKLEKVLLRFKIVKGIVYYIKKTS